MFLAAEKPTILAIGAHPDDVELGAGGFICRAVRELNAFVQILILTPGRRSQIPGKEYDPEQRIAESRTAATFLGLKSENVEVLDFEDAGLHLSGHKLIQAIENRVYHPESGVNFDLILTHSGGDTHADHREAFEATISALRSFHSTVLLYQSPSTKPNTFRPTVFVGLHDDVVGHKIDALRQHASQRDKYFLDEKWVKGIASTWAFFHRINAADGDSSTYWEAFEVYKAFWQ